MGLVYGGGSSPMSKTNIPNMSEIVAYDVCLPFHILVYYMKHSRSLLTPEEKDFLEGVVVMSFNSLCVDAKFICYLINESDFIEIVMSDISSNIENPPNKLEPKDLIGNFNLKE